MMPFSRLTKSIILVSIVVALAGCNRRSPEERLQSATEFMQQNDMISAEMEARKVIEKAPDDPAAIQARHLLAEIYIREERLEDAKAELEAALEKVSQKEELGRRTLQAYLAVLQRAQDYEGALKTVEKYQQENADDDGTSLSLEVARAEIQTRAGQTTTARQILQRLAENTTSPAELTLYRNLTVATFQRDNDTTRGIEYLQGQIAKVTDEQDRRDLLSALARSYAAVGNYEKTRETLVEATQAYDRAVERELDANLRMRMAFELGNLYAHTGNYAGARRVFQALFDSGIQDPQIVMVVSESLINTLIAQGDYDAFIGFLKEAAQRYPNLPFAQNAAQAESMRAAGQLSVRAPQDTSTLALRFREDKPVVPQNLPRSSLAATTDTLAGADGSTTGPRAVDAETTTAPVDTVTTSADAATASDSPSTSSQTAEQVGSAPSQDVVTTSTESNETGTAPAAPAASPTPAQNNDATTPGLVTTSTTSTVTE